MTALRSPVALAAAWSLAILVGLSLPGESVRALNPFTHDKFIHFGSFLGIAALWVRAYPSEWKRVLALVLLAAWITEPYQGLLPWANRQPDPLDAMANTLGLLTGTFAAHRRYVRSLPTPYDPTPPPSM